jgi:UDPglucose 6-dehydrogenase/GDP-mannose 6-dehydrogenase
VRVSIIGAGYVGVVTGACLAEQGHHVICVDLDQAKVDRLNEGKAPIFEEGLDELLASVAQRTLVATSDLERSVRDSDLTMVAVGTPSGANGIDLGQIIAACEAIGAALRAKQDYHLIVIKSTVVPGTTAGPVREALERSSGKAAGADFGLASNPEFLTEGTAVTDFRDPDRIVLGASDARAMGMLEELYASFADVPLIRTTPSSAEMIKYASNCLLATMISFSNEFARLCRTLPGVDAAEVMRGVHASQYLTTRLEDGRRIVAPIAAFLEAGCGYGGSCLPKDTRAIAAHGAELGAPMPLIEAVVAVNDDQPSHLVEMARAGLGSLRDKKITVLGVAFKPDTDDVRESPAIPIVWELLREGAHVRAHDPVALENAVQVLPEVVHLVDDLDAALEGADAVLLVTRWQLYESVPELLRRQRSSALLVDGRRVIPPDAVARYDGIGLGPEEPGRWDLGEPAQRISDQSD